MKKLIGTLAVASLAAAAAFAEISFGAWLRTLWVPVASDGENINSVMTNSWGGGARTARLNVSGTTDDGMAGYSMGIYNDMTNGISGGDDYVMWLKPIDQVRVSFGKWDLTTVRGDLCYGSWNFLRPNNWIEGGEGLTFPQLGNQAGALVEVTPVEGLYLLWNVPLVTSSGSATGAYKMFEQQHAAAMYTIDGIGKVKIGWQGSGARYYDSDIKNGRAKMGDVKVLSGDETANARKAFWNGSDKSGWQNGLMKAVLSDDGKTLDHYEAVRFDTAAEAESVANMFDAWISGGYGNFGIFDDNNKFKPITDAKDFVKYFASKGYIQTGKTEGTYETAWADKDEKIAMYAIKKSGDGEVRILSDTNGNISNPTEEISSLDYGVDYYYDTDTKDPYKLAEGGDEYKNLGTIAVAFDLTAVENLYVTVGGRVNIASSDYKKALAYDTFGTAIHNAFTNEWKYAKGLARAGEAMDEEDICAGQSFENAKITLGVSYNVLDNFKVYLDGGISIYDQPEFEDENGNKLCSVSVKPKFGFGVGVDYGINDQLSVCADFRFLKKLDNEIEIGGHTETLSYKPQMSFMVGMDYVFASNGILGIAFQGSTNGCGLTGVPAYDSDKFCWAVPIKMQIGF